MVLIWQLGEKINGDIPNRYFGRSCSMNSTGDIIGFGSGGNSNDYVGIYHYDSGVLNQLGSNIVGGVADNLGLSIDMSSDGTKIICGAPGNSYAEVYEYVSENWILRGNRVTESDPNFGFSVSMNGSGDIISVSAPDINTNNGGTVRMYQYNSNTSTWDIMGSVITGAILPGTNQFGISIDLNADGTRVIIGDHKADDNGTNSGSVYIYDWNGIVWDKIGSTIIAEYTGDSFGISVSINADGTIIAIGARSNGGIDNTLASAGHVRVFKYTTDWIQVGADIDGKSSGDFLGSSVSLNSDGTRLVTGGSAFSNTSSGCAKVYEYSGNAWTQIYSDIVGDLDDYVAAATVHKFGYKVMINATGDKIVATNFSGDLDTSGYAMYYNISYAPSGTRKTMFDPTVSNKIYSQHVLFMVRMLKKIKNNTIKVSSPAYINVNMMLKHL